MVAVICIVSLLNESNKNKKKNSSSVKVNQLISFKPCEVWQDETTLKISFCTAACAVIFLADTAKDAASK